MPAFLKDISPFYGTGENNSDGLSLEEFLKDYDPYKYKTPSCTADAVIFSCKGEPKPDVPGMKLLMVKRSNHPSIGFWALPGGFINLDEDLDDTAKRELKEETGVEDVVMEQIATYGNYDRDPRARVITTAYMALVDAEKLTIQAGDDAADAVWCDITLRLQHSKTVGAVHTNQYLLQVKNTEKELDTEAIVEQAVREGLIREQHFTVKEKGMIAVDHAAIIVQALTILGDRH